MFGPEYFTVAGYMPTDSGIILCRDCGDEEGLPASEQIMQSEFNSWDWNDGCYCDTCGKEIVSPYAWECPNCGREYFGEDATEIEKEYDNHPNHQCFEDCSGDEDPNPEDEEEE